jgi:hypothetical protein
MPNAKGRLDVNSELDWFSFIREMNVCALTPQIYGP